MAKETFFSPIMPFAMRPETSTRPARYHSGHLDREWQKDLIEPFQIDYQYAMKWEQGDPFRFQAKTTDGISTQLWLVSCAGDWLGQIGYTTLASIDGDLTADGTQLVTYHYNYQDLETAYGAPLPDGTYYLLFRVAYTFTEVGVWISEPIELAESHPDTLLFEYSNSSYKYGVPFETIPARFRLRAEGYISQMVPKSVSTVYQDQNYDTATLDFNPYRTWTLFLGQQGFGIPYWLIDKLNRILGLDNILIDGKQYSAAAANPSWAIEGPETTPLKSANVEIQEANEAEDFTTTDAILELWTSPGYPYVVGSVAIGPWIMAIPARIANLTEENAYIATLNAALGAHELLGSITRSGTSIRYNNGTGENYHDASVDLFTTKISWVFNPSIAAYVLTVGIGFGRGVMVWGDGTIELIESGATTTNFSHDYGSAGARTVEYWGGMQRFVLGTTQPAGLSGLTGTLPSGMTHISVSSMTFTSNTFNFAFVAPSASTLQQLSIFNCGLTAANNMPSYQFIKLKTINFSGNALSQTVMNLLIADVKGNAAPIGGAYPSILNGSLNVVQSPPQLLNATGAAAKSTLVSMGWTVNP